MGKQKNDMLHGSIWRGLPRFALPIAATAILGQLFNASDIAAVGNFAAQNRTAAVAAVGANSPIVSLIVNLFLGISLGSNDVIANAIGRRDESAIEKTVHTSIVIAVLGGVLVALLGELCASWLLRSFHVPEDVFDPALHYLRIYLLGMPVILLYNFEAAIFRSAGETKLPLGDEDRTSGGRAERRVFNFQPRHSGGNQHAGHQCDGRLKRGVQSGSDCVLRFQCLHAGMHDLCRSELRCRAAGPL